MVSAKLWLMSLATFTLLTSVATCARTRKLSGTTHNVFGIQVWCCDCVHGRKARRVQGVARFFYARRPEMERANEKLEFLRDDTV